MGSVRFSERGAYLWESYIVLYKTSAIKDLDHKTFPDEVAVVINNMYNLHII